MPIPSDADTGAVLQELANRCEWIHVDHDDARGIVRVAVLDRTGRVVFSDDVWLGQAAANILAKLHEQKD